MTTITDVQVRDYDICLSATATLGVCGEYLKAAFLIFIGTLRVIDISVDES